MWVREALSEKCEVHVIQRQRWLAIETFQSNKDIEVLAIRWDMTCENCMDLYKAVFMAKS